MQSLDIISVNIWHILISLVNLLLIFLIVKKFLYGPVKKLLSERQADIDSRYAAADEAKKQALESKAIWDEKMKNADSEAESIIKGASDTASYRAEQIIEEANSKAEIIKKRAENEAQLTRQMAEESIKQEIVEVSSAIAEKMLEREIKTDDHRAMIDSFINGLDE